MHFFERRLLRFCVVNNKAGAMFKTLLLITISVATCLCQEQTGCDLIDLGLVIDSSSGIGAKNFGLVRSFVLGLITELNVGLNNTRIAAINVNRRVYPLWSFVDSNNTTGLIADIQNLELDTRIKQRLSKAIGHLANNEFRSSGDRKGVPDLAVIFTNGLARDIPDVRSRRLKRKNIQVMVVAVGDDVNNTQINGIASYPSEENVFSINDVMEVVAAVKKIADKPCSEDSEPICHGNQEFSACAGCTVSCSDRNEDVVCPPVCRRQCTCPPNTYLLKDQCVTEDECPPVCPPTMVFSTCAVCTRQCYQIGPTTCPFRCRNGCTCPPLTFLHKGRCVSMEQCPPTRCGFNANTTTDPQPLNFYGYPSLYNKTFCEWRIAARPGHHVLLTVNHFVGFQDDVIAVVDGDYEVSPIVRNFKRALASESNTFILRFSSIRRSFHRSDFRLTYQEVSEIPKSLIPPPIIIPTKAPCGFIGNATAKNQWLRSPGWSDWYANNLDCEWTITARPGYRMQFDFTTFQTEECCDYLAFFENGKEVRRIEGNYERPVDIQSLVSSNEKITLKFHSDSSRTARGFQATYKETTNMANIDLGNCGFVARASIASQMLTSPGWPAIYQNKQNCSWNISSLPGSVIMLEFLSFDTEKCCDYLQVTDKEGETRRFAGSFQELETRHFVSQGNQLELQFVSDRSEARQGFNAIYREFPIPLVVDGDN